MRLVKYLRLLTSLWLILLLGGGFAATGLIAHHAANDVVEYDYATLVSPEAAELVAAELNNRVKRLGQAVERLAGDPSVRGWIEGEGDDTRLAQGMKEVERRFDLDGSFAISLRARRQFKSGGFSSASNRTALENALHGGDWNVPSYEVNPSPDVGDGGAIAVSALRRVVDPAGTGGVVGAGIASQQLQGLLNFYQHRFGCRIRLVDRAGIVVVGEDAMHHLKDVPGLRSVADSVLAAASGAPTTSRYRYDLSTTFVDSRLLPDLDLYLVVEQSNLASVRPIWTASVVNGAIAAAVVLLAVLGVLWTQSLKTGACSEGPGTDAVTGVMNEAAYGFVFRQALIETQRSGEPFCLMIVRVDRLSRITERVGIHLGNHILKQITEQAHKSVRVSDPVARWCEDGFIIHLRDCPLDRATAVGDRLRQNIEAHDFGLSERKETISVSIGVALCAENEEGDAFMQRTEQALEEASSKGGNCIVAAEDPVPDEEDSPAPEAS